MSSRRERRKKLYSTSRETPTSIQPRVRTNPVTQRSVGTSGQMRTISPRAFKIIIVAVIVIILLLLTAPKPSTPPGALGEAIGPQTQTPFKPVELDMLKATIPPVNTSTGSALGETLKAKIKIN